MVGNWFLRRWATSAIFAAPTRLRKDSSCLLTVTSGRWCLKFRREATSKNSFFAGTDLNRMRKGLFGFFFPIWWALSTCVITDVSVPGPGMSTRGFGSTGISVSVLRGTQKNRRYFGIGTDTGSFRYQYQYRYQNWWKYRNWWKYQNRWKYRQLVLRWKYQNWCFYQYR